MHAMKANSVVKVQLHTFTTSALQEISKHGYFPGEGPPVEGRVAINASQDALETRKISCSYRELNHDSWVVQPVAQIFYRVSYPGSCVIA
jgi:hypothetical protein